MDLELEATYDSDDEDVVRVPVRHHQHPNEGLVELHTGWDILHKLLCVQAPERVITEIKHIQYVSITPFKKYNQINI